MSKDKIMKSQRYFERIKTLYISYI